MNLLDALTTLLDATVELDDRPHLRRARRRLAEKAEALQAKRQRLRDLAEGRCYQCQQTRCVSVSQCPFAAALGDAKQCNCCPTCRQKCHR
jgi:hypothetical protein